MEPCEDVDSMWQALVQRAALARRSNDTEELRSSLEEILKEAQDLRGGEPGVRALQMKDLESKISKEFGVDMTVWLCPYLLRDELATVAEELIEELAAAKKEEVLNFDLGPLGLIQLSVAKDVSDWTMADGRFIWHGAHACLKLIVDGHLDVKDKVILELGCGLGLVGMACARAGAQEVLLTDYDMELLSACSKSIDLNHLHKKVFTERLDWNQVSSGAPLGDRLRERTFDFLLGADIIYDADHAKHVLGTLLRLLRDQVAKEAILITGEPEKRQGIAELDNLLSISEVSENVSHGQHECLTCEAVLLREVAHGRRHRMYRFWCLSEPLLEPERGHLLPPADRFFCLKECGSRCKRPLRYTDEFATR